MIRPHFLAGKEDVNAAAGPSLRAVKKLVYLKMVNKARCLECRPYRRQITAPNQQIDIACIADRVLVNPGDPLGDGVPTDDRVGYLRRIQRGAMSALSQPTGPTAASAIITLRFT